MSRPNISSAYVSSSVQLIQPYVAAYMDFSGSAVRLWTGNTTKSFSDDSAVGSGSYLGVGTFGGISAVTETTQVAAKGIDLILSAIPQEYVSLVIGDNYRGRNVSVYLILFDPAMTSYEKITLFRGRMDQIIITDNEATSTINMKCESRLIDLNRAKDVRYTDEAQKLLFPTDKGLEFVASMADKSIYWGSAAPVSVGNSGGGADSGGGDGSTTGYE